jgi:hypothetical protein
MPQRESPSRTSGARTSDWIGRAEGRVIYAYDLSTLNSENEGETGASGSPERSPRAAVQRRAPAVNGRRRTR